MVVDRDIRVQWPGGLENKWKKTEAIPGSPFSATQPWQNLWTESSQNLWTKVKLIAAAAAEAIVTLQHLGQVEQYQPTSQRFTDKSQLGQKILLSVIPSFPKNLCSAIFQLFRDIKSPGDQRVCDKFLHSKVQLDQQRSAWKSIKSLYSRKLRRKVQRQSNPIETKKTRFSICKEKKPNLEFIVFVQKSTSRVWWSHMTMPRWRGLTVCLLIAMFRNTHVVGSYLALLLSPRRKVDLLLRITENYRCSVHKDSK